jgi:hypothetical protein
MHGMKNYIYSADSGSTDCRFGILFDFSGAVLIVAGMERGNKYIGPDSLKTS